LQVRVAIASQLHLVAATVPSTEASRLLLRPLVALLHDGCPAVRQALLPGLGQTLQVGCSAACDAAVQGCSVVYEALCMNPGRIQQVQLTI
jgi:hypothetical protein